MIHQQLEIKEILAYNPFKSLDINFAKAVKKANAFPIITFTEADEVTDEILEKIHSAMECNFGIICTQKVANRATCFTHVDLIILPFSDVKTDFPLEKTVYQVTSLEQAIESKAQKVHGIIIKGNEAAGNVAEESSFILFQKVIKQTTLPVWVQGGIGIHTSAAVMAFGAKGVVLDFQLAHFPELNLPQEIKQTIDHLEGSETKILHGHRVYIKRGNKALEENATTQEFNKNYTPGEYTQKIISLSQDIGLSKFYYNRYKKIKNMVFALREAKNGHAQQAKYFQPLIQGNALALELGIEYPIAQGPMTRVSDVPEFAHAIAQGGALPFIALSLLKGEKAQELLSSTKELLQDKSWGVGVLGFIDPEILKEQFKYIEQSKPTAVIIAGGRPSQSKQLERLGIKSYLHAPSVGLLDAFLKEGAKRYIFEGRECGGHVGPLSSFILWDRQINRLLEEDDLSTTDIFFAGGIHDELSSAMVSLMAAPLVARGARIGVIMGTSYLLTKEAVETGAILKQFQHHILEKSETCLLESSVGHVTRCLKTPFTDQFEVEKKKLQESQTDAKAIGKVLEDLNIGRLRIASKGLERQGEKLIPINAKQQLERGLYMIGQVANLRSKPISIDQLHQSISQGADKLINKLEIHANNTKADESIEIAIIGMACLFPEAANLEQYWKNILQGKDSITEVPDQRWNKELYYDPKSKNGLKSISKSGGFIPTTDFDPLFFGIPPQSLAAIEPVQLLSLKIAYDALKDAGYDKKSFDRENTSVIFGVESGSDLASGYDLRSNLTQFLGAIPPELDKVLPTLTEDSFAGVLPNVVAGRIANRLDFGGRNLTVDAACGSSLAAVDVACQDLLLGRSEMVLVGGADLHNNIADYLKFSSTQALTADGKCKTFDQSADGISLGEGIAVIVLKRVEDARRDNDQIYAVIKAVGSSSDGKSLGLTAPRKLGQIRAFERAYSNAGISPSEVGLMEAHGTGTNVGDKTELSAMTELMLAAGALPGQATLGSVKTQIGHTKCAAGLAGLIKVALAVQHGIKPPTLNIVKPNLYYKAANSPFIFTDKSAPWLNAKRVAGVSAFGFGGTNFHVVLQNEASNHQAETTTKQWPLDLVPFRANSDTELTNLLELIKKLILSNGNIQLKDIAYTLSLQDIKPIRLTLVAHSTAELLTQIVAVLQKRVDPTHHFTKIQEGKLAFLFSGQGSQRINMARDLFVAIPQMRKLLSNHKNYEKILFPDRSFDPAVTESQKELIKDTRNAQPLLGMVDYAIAQYLISLGIKPDMLAGHSYGELPALAIAGAINEKDLVTISHLRAQAIMEAVNQDAGAMVAVNCPANELKEILENEDGVSIVNHNSALQWVVAGTTKDILRVCNKLKGFNKSYKKLEVACAFHSPVISASKTLFQQKLNPFVFNNLKIPVYSNTTSKEYPVNGAQIKERLCEHLVEPVKYYDEILNMFEHGARIFIETGPGNVLTKLTQSILTNQALVINTEQASQDGLVKIVETLAQYIACGREINFEKFYEGRDVKQIDLTQIEKYALTKSIWKVDGQRAIPTHGTLPANAATLVTEPLMLSGNPMAAHDGIQTQETDKRLMEYLANIQVIVKSQQDIMMSYLGHTSPTRLDSSSLAIPYMEQLSHQESLITADSMKQEKLFNNTKTETEEILDIKSIVLDTVSAKTGYPIDMLNMDMDLEADLSIDSIKRIEIVTLLKTTINEGSTKRVFNDEIIEKLAAIKTLNGLVDWLTKFCKQESPKVSQHQTQQTVNPPQTVNTIPQLDIKGTLLRVVCEKTGYPMEMLDMDMDLEADLSIDSIKRVEIISKIKEALGGFGNVNQQDDIIEKLAAIKTLNGLLDWLTANVIQEVKTPTLVPNNAPRPTVDTNSQISAGNAQSSNKSDNNMLSQERVTEILLEIVSQKTGYPTDMLGLDMDLEADLSIDSIKRVEIISVVRSQIDLQSNKSDNEDIIEKLSNIKTLRGVVEWIAKSLAATQNPSQNNVTPLEIANDKIDYEEVLRVDFELKKSYPKQKIGHSLKGVKIAITDDGGYQSALLKKQFESQQAQVTLVTEADSLHGFDGLIVLELFNAPKRLNITAFFAMVQKLDYKEVQWIYAVTDITRHLKGEQHPDYVDDLQGYYGFLNSLNKEWDAKCKTINLQDEKSVKNAGEIILNELSYQDNSSEVHYIDTQRHLYDLFQSSWDESHTKIELTKESVVLVLGGAQGITAEILKELSHQMPCNYVLAGRSPLPEEVTDNITACEANAIRTALLSQEKFKTPLELEQRVQFIYKRNQILITKAALEKNGSQVFYYALDLTNETKLKSLLDELYNKFGKIDGVIHAIGYLDDKFFHKKTFDSFNKVFTTKVSPLKVLSKHLRKETKFCILFSSIASVMGNKGQVDYAAANSVLDQAAAILDRKIDGRAYAINWGPWKGKGMISEALEKDLLKRGITSISLEAGAKAFVKELKHGYGSQIILMTPVEEMALAQSQIEFTL